MNIDPALKNTTQKVISLFFPNRPNFEIQSFGSGLIHQTFLLRFPEGKQFILQKINPRIFPQAESLCENIHQIAQYLRSVDYPFEIPKLIASAKNNWTVKDKAQNSWRLFHYISDTFSFDQANHPKLAYSASRAFGIFCRQMADFAPVSFPSAIPDFHNCQFRLQQMQQAIADDPVQRLRQVREEVETLQQFDFCSSWRKLKIPLRWSHNDTKINNILFSKTDQKPVAIIDLDTVMLASPLFDFGDMVRTYTSTVDEETAADQVEMRLPFFAALCAGFLEGTGDLLIPKERSALLLSSFLAVHVQAQRFLTDYLQGDIYYQTQYPEQNLLRAQNQLALLQSMVRQKSAMQSILHQYL